MDHTDIGNDACTGSPSAILAWAAQHDAPPEVLRTLTQWSYGRAGFETRVCALVQYKRLRMSLEPQEAKAEIIRLFGLDPDTAETLVGTHKGYAKERAEAKHRLKIPSRGGVSHDAVGFPTTPCGDLPDDSD
jgi:hypothetical protein